ncbi:MAG TPA: DUF4097 family beta strand repeat-containing protein [Gemmatimonadales bacterium]
MPRPLVLAASLLLAAVPLRGQATKSYVLAGDRVEIYNLAGEITMQGGVGNAVTIEVTTVGSDAGRLGVESGEIRGVGTLRVTYPADRIVYPKLGQRSSTTLYVRDDGTWGDDSDRRHAGRKITIRGDGAGLEAAANLRIAIPPGRKVSVYLGVGRLDAADVDGQLVINAISADVSARRTRGALDIDTGAGNVRVETVGGRVSLDTGSGDVAISGLQNGSLEVETGSGSVSGSKLQAQDLQIDTGSGDIHLEDTSAPRLDLESGSGSIRAELTSGFERLSVETASGDVTVRLPDGTGAELDLDTGSGDFTIDVPVTLLKRSESSLRGRIGDGNARIHIETGSGDIALLR